MIQNIENKVMYLELNKFKCRIKHQKEKTVYK